MTRRSAWIGLAFFLFGLTPSSGYATAQFKAATTLESLDIQLADGGVQAVVVADGVMEHRVYQLEEPPHLVLDIMNVRNSLEGRRPREPHPFLKVVQSQELPMTAYDREAPRGSMFARITFELKQPMQHSIRVDEKRIELSIYPAGRGETAVDPGGEANESPAATPAAEVPFPEGYRIEPEGVDPAFSSASERAGPSSIGSVSRTSSRSGFSSWIS